MSSGLLDVVADLDCRHIMGTSFCALEKTALNLTMLLQKACEEEYVAAKPWNQDIIIWMKFT